MNVFPSDSVIDSLAFAGEASFDELLRDPIIQLVMQKDGVSYEHLARVIEAVKEALAD